MTRVLAVDHNAVTVFDRGLYQSLAAEQDIHLTLLVPRSWREMYGTTTFEPEQSALRVVAAGVLFNGRSHRVLYPSLGSLLRRTRPDVLYVNAEPESFLAAQAVALRKRVSPGTRVVIDSWRNIDHRAVGYPYKFGALHAWIENDVRKAADACIAHAESIRATLSQQGIRNIHVIPPAVDTRAFAPAAVDGRKGSSPFTIGYLGRFIREKGIDLLLRAVSQLREDVRVVLTGAGPALDEWKALASELGLAEKVRWNPGGLHSTVPAALRDLDLVVLPSRTGDRWKEQFGRVLIESMACGVPVIGSSSGEIPTVIGKAGLTFEEGNADQLAAKIRELIATPGLMESCREKGLERVKREFDLPLIASRYADMFRSVGAARLVETLP